MGLGLRKGLARGKQMRGPNTASTHPRITASSAWLPVLLKLTSRLHTVLFGMCYGSPALV